MVAVWWCWVSLTLDAFLCRPLATAPVANLYRPMAGVFAKGGVVGLLRAAWGVSSGASMFGVVAQQGLVMTIYGTIMGSSGSSSGSSMGSGRIGSWDENVFGAAVAAVAAGGARRLLAAALVALAATVVAWFVLPMIIGEVIYRASQIAQLAGRGGGGGGGGRGLGGGGGGGGSLRGLRTMSGRPVPAGVAAVLCVQGLVKLVTYEFALMVLGPLL